MRQIIHNYKLRLTNLSQGNRSLKLGKLSRRKDMDLKDLGFLEKDSAEEILKKIIAGKSIRLINRLDPRHEATNVADRRLNNIYREVNTIFQERGTYDLFVGYPWVEGKFVDGTVARCPVLLFPVQLHRDLQARPRWKLTINSEEPVRFNKTFFLAYEQFQQVRLKEEFWEEEIEKGNDWLEWLNALYQKVKDYDLEVNFNPRLFDQGLVPFTDYLTATMNHFPVGKLKFQPHAVLGIFPQSDSALLQDYEQIEREVEDLELGEYFEQSSMPSSQREIEDVSSYIREEERYFVSPVDQSQESALLHIKEGRSLVVHGPPGTGKSQVIVNIIADAMAHGKKVLLVSQKRAALDVVYKRLSQLRLGRFAVLVHDYRQDRASIYRKIKQQIDDIDAFKREVRDLNITKWEHDYKLLSRQADQLHRQFEELFMALSHPKAFGTTVHELYLHTDIHAKKLPVNEEARRLDEGKLGQFLGKMIQVLDYKDFYDPAYPWRERISFHHFGYEDRVNIQALIGKIEQELEHLHRLFSERQVLLGENILEERLNKESIQAFRIADKYFVNQVVRADMEAIHQEADKTGIRVAMEEVELCLNKLDKRKYFDDGHWALYENLVEHTENYKQWKEKRFRTFSLSYQRARWFFSKVLARHDLKFEPSKFRQIDREIKYYIKLHKWYASSYEKDFFDDFPLYETQEEKYDWLDRKKANWKAYQYVQALDHFPKIRPKFNDIGFDRTAWQAAMREIEQLAAFTEKMQAQFMAWRHFLHPNQIEVLQEGIKDTSVVKEYIEKLGRTFAADFSDLKTLDVLLADFSTLELVLLEKLKPFVGKETDAQEFLAQIRNSVYYFWIEMAEREHPVLVEVSGRGWNRKALDFSQKLSDRRVKVTELILRRIKERIIGIIQYNRLKNPITYRQIYHQVSKKRRLWSVRKLINECWEEGLHELVPCWMASPESAAAIFPMKKDFFDIVVFDEASQCFVERALPVMLRGTQCVIAGDHQQLQPLDLYNVKYEDVEAEFVESEVALEVESILDLAKTLFQETKLSWHYRSQEEELINFSNHAFYEGKLQVIPPARHDPLNFPALEWIEVKGKWERNRNEPEGKRVIELVLKLVQRPDNPSIGIVTFNFHQQELIKDLLDQEMERLAKEDVALYNRLIAALTKVENEQAQGIFVKNIENVQGDERDIIIFSIGYGYDFKGKLNARFGLLNQRGGENRLNVAITRARKKSYVVCSFLPAELNVEQVTNVGPKMLKEYLQYVKAVSEERMLDAINLLNLQHEEDITVQQANPIAEELAEALRQKGYHVVRNMGDTSYRLDLAVKASPGAKSFLLGIECEGSHYFSGASTKEREVYRHALLRERGWNLYRVWARNWWANKEEEIKGIIQLLEAKNN